MSPKQARSLSSHEEKRAPGEFLPVDIPVFPEPVTEQKRLIVGLKCRKIGFQHHARSPEAFGYKNRLLTENICLSTQGNKEAFV